MAKRGNGANGERRLTKVLETADQKVRGSQAWTSIFRPGSVFRRGYTDSPRNRSYVIMNNVLYHLHPVKVKRHAVKVSYTLCLGGLSFFLFILLTITGIFLMALAYAVIPSEWITFSDKYLRWTPDKVLVGTYLIKPNYQQLRDLVVVVIYSVFFGANLLLWVKWQQRLVPKPEPAVEEGKVLRTSRFGRPVKSKA